MDWRLTLVRNAAERAADTERRHLRRGLSGLATVAATAPFVGLVGTVLGIPKSFVSCGCEKSVLMAAIMSGLADSLMPAVVGLGLAILSLSGYRILIAQAGGLEAEVRQAARDLPALLHYGFFTQRKPTSGFAPRAGIDE